MATTKAKMPSLVQHYVTGSDLSLREWHTLLRKAAMALAIILIAGSIVSLNWACINFVGLEGNWFKTLMAWAVPLAMEAGMAMVASVATTTTVAQIARKMMKDADELGEHLTPATAAKKARRLLLVLWLIFSFLMALSQASNVAHAMSYVALHLHRFPPMIPATAIFVFAGLFAALFPLGGTMFVHVAGFLRTYGTGADWIGDDAQLVSLQQSAGAAHQASHARAPQPRPAAQPKQSAARAATTPDKAPRAQATPPGAEQEATPPQGQSARDAAAAVPMGDLQARAREVFDRLVAASPTVRPDAAVVWRESGLNELDPANGRPIKNQATVRRWCNDQWWPEHQASLGQGADDPIVAQAQADDARAEQKGDEQPPRALRTA